MTKKILIAVLFFLIVSQIAAAQTTYQADTTISISDGQPYQISLNVSNATGTNNATNVYCNGHCNANFSDVYFQMSSTNLSYWIENTTSPAKFWINVTSNGTVSMLYGGNAANASNGTSTFLQYNGSQTSSSIAPLVVNVTDRAFEAKVRATSASHNLRWGMSNSLSVNDDYMFLQSTTGTNVVQFEVANENVPTAKNQAPAFTANTSYKLKLINTTGGITAYINDAQYLTVTNTNLPNELLGLFFLVSSGTGSQEYSFARRYISPEPQWATWGAEQAITYIPIVASNTIQYSDDGVDFTNSPAYILLNEVTVTENYIGSWRITFELSGTTFGGIPFTGVAKIYKNDVAIGTERQVSGGGFTQFDEDFTNISIVSGDRIQLYARVSTVQFAYIQNFRVKFDYDYANATPIPTYPQNGSTLSFNFPPQTSDINFTWSQIGSSGYQIQIAEDAAFSLIEVDTTTTNNYSVQAMDAGTHYWRVRTYNDAGATLGNWSNTFFFSFSETTPSVSGTAINGVVFEYIGGVQTPISGASVYLTNSTATFTALTGTNGYFLFTTNISNASTYSLYAIKQGYDNSQVFAVTPTYNNVTTVNLPMRIYISPYVPNFVFEKFIVRSLFDDPYPGVTVNIFVNGNVNPSFTGTTDSMGQVVFQLIKDTYYRIELSGGGLPVTITEYFYGKEEAYYITIATGFPDNGDKFEDINASLFVTQINATYANLSLYYYDNSSTTSTINFFARYYSNNTNVCADQNSVTYPVTLNCTVFMGNITYVFGWNSTSSKYGFSQGTDVVDFKANNVTKQIPGLQEKLGSDMLNWISIIGLIFVAGLFSARSVRYGVVVVPFAAVILYWAGTLQVSALLVHSALILGILSYLRMSEQKVIS